MYYVFQITVLYFNYYNTDQRQLQRLADLITHLEK